MAAPANHVNLSVPMRSWPIGGEAWEFRANNRAFYELEKAHGFTLPFFELVNLNSLRTDKYRILWAMTATYRTTKAPVIQTFEEWLDALPVHEEFMKLWNTCFTCLEEAFPPPPPSLELPADDEDDDPDEDAEGNEMPALSEPDPPTGSDS